MDFNLPPPVQKESPLFTAWVSDCFTRITRAFTDTHVERKGVNAVTGTLTVVTGLTKVNYAHASFNGDPSVAAMTLSCRPGGTAGTILINVFAWGNTWAPSLIASTTPINVNWVAYGF